MMVRTSLICLLCFLSAPSFAQTEAPVPAPASPTTNLRFLAGMALEFGGESVAEILFTNGETQDMPAGQGLNVYAGGELALGQSEKFRLRGSLGFKYLTTQADNVHIRLTRVPIQLTANYMVTDKIRLGAGLVMHQSIRLNLGGLAANQAFQPATGFIVEASYRGVGLSFTPMTYQDLDGTSYNASAIGLTFSGSFSKKK